MREFRCVSSGSFFKLLLRLGVRLHVPGTGAEFAPRVAVTWNRFSFCFAM